MSDISEFKDELDLHFLMDSDGKLYQVTSEEVAIHPRSSAVVDRVDDNTVYFCQED